MTTPHTARDPNKIQEVELESEDLQGMIRQPPKVGAIQGVLDDSPVIINWNGLDPTDQAEITPTLETLNNWIIFTHPLGAEDDALPLPRYRKAPREYFIQKAKLAGREGGGGRERTNLPRTA